MAKIIILSGPAKGLEYKIVDQGILGRQSDNSVPLQDTKASRQHTLILLKEDGYYIEDLESRNGTVVNGKPITKQQLFDNDQITIGTTILLFDSKKHQRPAALCNQQPDEAAVGEEAQPQEMLTLDQMLQKAEQLVPAEIVVPEMPKPQLRQDGILRSKRKEQKPPRVSATGRHPAWSFLAADFSTNSLLRKIMAILLLLLLMGIITMVARWLTLTMLN